MLNRELRSLDAMTARNHAACGLGPAMLATASEKDEAMKNENSGEAQRIAVSVKEWFDLDQQKAYGLLWNAYASLPGRGSNGPTGYEILEAFTPVLEAYAAQAITAERERQWVSVKEKLPKEHQIVLVAMAECVTLSQRGFDGNDWFWCEPDDDATISENFYNMDGEPAVTHWMPLPKPPRAALRNSAEPPQEEK